MKKILCLVLTVVLALSCAILPAMADSHPLMYKVTDKDGHTIYLLGTLHMMSQETLPIANLCNRILPDGEQLQPFGREGAEPIVAQYSEQLLRQTLEDFRAAGHQSIAVITRSQSQADSLSTKLDNVYRLDGGEADLNYEAGDNVVACYHLTKGMEFDAVIVVWPDVELTGDERRRLYTAASRALHAAALLGGGKLIKELRAER